MLYFAFLFTAIVLYCLLAILFKLPTFKAVKAFRKTTNDKTGTLSLLITDGAKTISKILPMSMLKEIEIQKLLDAANIKKTPKTAMSEILLVAVAPLILVFPAYMVTPFLATLPPVFSIYLYIHKYNGLSRLGDKRKICIEKELPGFISYMANALKSNRNVLDMMDTYRLNILMANTRSPLAEELAITAADMRTGNAELALQRLEIRINSPFMSELVRGLLSAMRGDDMVAYYENMGNELSNVWEQRVRLQALKKEPKIARMSYIILACAILTIVVALAITVKSASSLMTGLGS